ncbi:hypothetical protein VNO80_24843 [Phaseolus coccineus]|uniref:Uncharacterized protein n=1 Tax=Phaseolus coccineus TaxID=3886 RepID=A0AAN9LY05_PHACN
MATSVSLPCFSHTHSHNGVCEVTITYSIWFLLSFCWVEPPCQFTDILLEEELLLVGVAVCEITIAKKENIHRFLCALAETAASMAVAVTVIGAAATVLVKRSKTSE